MDTNSTNVLGGVVDRLGEIAAQISTLKTEEKALKAELAASGVIHHEGQEYRAAVSLISGKVNIDWRAVAERFQPSRQLVRAYTSTIDDHYVVRVSARKTS